MSLQYCEDCDKNIDLDEDLEHECFRPKDDLKTVKDFELCELLDSTEFKIISSVSKAVIIKGEIKDLAIKWVKADCEYNDWRILFKKFNNITSEDLK